MQLKSLFQRRPTLAPYVNVSIARQTYPVPALFAGDQLTAKAFIRFFVSEVENAHTRRAYAHAVDRFARWSTKQGIAKLAQLDPVMVGQYRNSLARSLAPPSVKLHLAGIRALFDSLVVSGAMPVNLAASVKGPIHRVDVGQTPVLSGAEVRALLDSIDAASAIGARDRALIATMAYTFLRVGAVTRMKASNLQVEKQGLVIVLREKGGKTRRLSCHSALQPYLREYIRKAGMHPSSRDPFFRSASPSGALKRRPMRQADVFRMIRRRARAAGIDTRVGCHTFRATGITEFLKAGGTLDKAQRMAGHKSARTTRLYDRRAEEDLAKEIERLSF